MPEYADLLKEIDELERQPEKVGLSSVDISCMLDGGQVAAAPDYHKMLGIVEDFESQLKNVVGKQQAIKQEHKMQIPEQDMHKLFDMHAAVPAAKPTPMQDELKKIIAELPKTTPKFNPVKIKPISSNGIVLPSLQTSDQLHELEHIISALKESSFDKEQIGIVKLELGGLDRHVRELKKELLKEKKSLNPLDQSLCDMRDQRLNEALALLKS